MTTDPAAPGPHVDRSWADRFVVELRLQGATGEQIGDALGEVGDHCADAGHDAHSEFGEPVQYAREVAAALRTSSGLGARDAVAVLTQTAGVMGAVWALPAWLHDDPVTASRGAVTIAALTLLLAAAVCARPASTVGVLARLRWWQAGLLGAAVAGLLAAAAAVVADGPVTIPSAPLAATSVTLLTVGTVALLTTGGPLHDPVRRPGATHTRRRRLVGVASVAALPLVALLVAGLLALLPR